MAYPKTHGYQHAEAFALMQYSCKTCGHRETIWNARDGVTPFMCSCPSCGQTMQHVDFNLDIHAPQHRLHPGQRFWRDGTPDEAETIMRKRIEVMRGQFPCSPDEATQLINNARTGKLSEFQLGWPYLDVAPMVKES